MRVILFLVDALRSDYINSKNTPFLSRYLEKGIYIKHIIPSSGFCERTEIFTGLTPDISNMFTAIGYSPLNSPYKKIGFIRLLACLESIINSIGNERLNSIFRYIIIRFFSFFLKKNGFNPYNIPFSLLKYFSLTEDFKCITEWKYSNHKTLIDTTNSIGVKTYLNSFTDLKNYTQLTDQDNINLALDNAKNFKFIFFPIYIGLLDSTGHKYGPESAELAYDLKYLDNLISNSVKEFLKIDSNLAFVILGDHGMTKVRKTIDINSTLLELTQKIKLKVEKDFIYFLDSTLLRVWYLSENAKKKLPNLLLNNELLNLNGQSLNEKDFSIYSIPNDRYTYGDYIWWANSGVIIFPNFFNSGSAPKGMHGYKPNTLSTYGTCIIHGNSIERNYINSLHLFEINKIITDLLTKTTK